MNGTQTNSATTDGWSRIAVLLLFGYCLLGRSFAYLGFPPWHIFVGELALAAFLLAGPETVMGPWVTYARRIWRLRRLIKLYLALLLYGIFEVLRGIALGHPLLTSVRDLAFDYYPLFLLLGIWVAWRKPQLLRGLFRNLAWFNAVYGIAYVLFLNRVTWVFPGVSDQLTPVPIFGLPEFSFVILLGLLVCEPKLGEIWHLLLLNAFVLLGMQIRAEWLGLAVGLFLWACVTRNLKRFMAGSAAVAAVLALMLVLNFSARGPVSRGPSEISARDLVGRALAPVDPDLAADYTSSVKMDVGTTVWRTIWWAAIWESVNQSRRTALLGLGYGYPIGNLVPYLEGDFIQTPHDAFFYALGYSGWIGVLVFALFQAELARLLWRTYRRTGRLIGIILWAAMLAFALFTPFFEVPQGAIPFYILLGFVVGAGMLRTRQQPLIPSSVLPAPQGCET
ncbi:MAG: O-antigen ligase family protein [Candidatus Acidiferrales bacterium]